MISQQGSAGGDRTARRFILVERAEGGSALDLALYAPKSEAISPADAAQNIMTLAIGEMDDVYEPVSRDEPGAFCDMYVPPDGFPHIGLPGRDGDPRPETKARVAQECEYVATLKQRS